MGMGYKWRKWTEQDKKDMAERWFAGETYAEIAKAYDVSTTIVLRKIKEYLETR